VVLGRIDDRDRRERSADGRAGGIMLEAADGSGQSTMVPGTETAYPDYVSNPAWSPDGRWLAYEQGYPGKIVLVHPDGSERRTLHVDPGNDSIEEIAWGTASP
jgi:hypothetical protein